MQSGADSGVSLYEWTVDGGTWRLTPVAAAVPGTRSALSALGYLASTLYDSVFILNDMAPLLSSQGLQMALLGALMLDGPASRRVVLPACSSSIPADLRQISR